MYALVGQQLQNIVEVPLSASNTEKKLIWKEVEVEITNSDYIR